MSRPGSDGGTLLVLQEGPGAGRTYLLDPSQKVVLSVGRSSSCDVVVNDERSSRHHADMRWTGQQWEVADLESTNGTYVNGLRVHRPYPLRPGDRVTVGDTTMVLRTRSDVPAAAIPAGPGGMAAAAGAAGRGMAAPSPVEARVAAPRPAEYGANDGRTGVRGSSIAFWSAQVVVTIAVVCLAAGSLLPWLEITGGVRGDVAPLLEQGFNIWGALTGTDPSRTASYVIDGTMAHGKLTLVLALVSTVALVVEIFFYRRSLIPGVVYLVTGLMVVATMGFDAMNYAQHARELQNLDLLFGYQLGDLTNLLGTIIDVEARALVGVYLVGAGLGLLLAGGVARVLSGVLGERLAV